VLELSELTVLELVVVDERLVTTMIEMCSKAEFVELYRVV
jgi:hypothetical protein